MPLSSADALTGGTASASAYATVEMTPDKACDDDIGTKWASYSEHPAWWRYDFGAGNGKVIQKYTILSEASNPVSEWTFQGSNDASSWTTLDSQTDQPTGTKKTYTITNTTAYRYYRIYITYRNGTYAYLKEVEMFAWVGVNRSPKIIGLPW